ncbi:hypothetical protein PR202_gb28785 [Eleusine coracana subsp. coracana]|uniref:Uncharacterized protein n=1 Tax=Eleusine coracana subsp. coracana TaxID=191504 RepID=A0AAV5FXX9_ELECO|nr:hypothetical protein QOZ80_8BG0645180 [Eleusine coracana subsp. coracana]GJN39653.1 hypothetical protein PR202_gb28785 [Eleusine coracana subsp. coracana]
MKTEDLDYVLVPLGLAVMAGYHAWLLLRVRRRPATTVIGVNAINRRIWVRHVMEDPSGKHAVLAVQTIRNNIMASTLLASTAITLSSLIAVLMSSGGGGSATTSSSTTTTSSSGSNGLLPGAPLVVGATGLPALTAKFFAILVCFLVAFLLNVQSIRYYSHASVLVNVPLAARRRAAIGYATAALDRGSYFWSFGARTFYFSCPVFLWLFGPIPMLVACVALVCALYFLDVCEDWEEDDNGDVDDADDDRGCISEEV